MMDVIIIGKGPAGISAALYTARAGLSTLIIGKDEGSLGKAEKIENYYGFPEPISGNRILENGIKQAKRLGVEIIDSEVISIEYGESFTVKTADNAYIAKTVLLATGVSRKAPKLEGIKEFEGIGVSYCAVCDAFFYRGKDVAVLGAGAYAASEATELLAVASKVTVLTNGETPTVEMPKGAIVKTQKLLKLLGDGRLDMVAFDDGTSLNISGLFIALGVAGSVDFARKLGVLVQNDKIMVNEKQATNLPGLFAAGDCIGGVLQISKAVSDGAKAGLEIISHIRNNK